MAIEIRIQSTDIFSEAIEGMVSDNEDMTYLEAILLYSEKEGLEYSTISKIISKNIKEKLRAEAIDKNMLGRRKTGKL